MLDESVFTTNTTNKRTKERNPEMETITVVINTLIILSMGFMLMSNVFFNVFFWRRKRRVNSYTDFVSLAILSSFLAILSSFSAFCAVGISAVFPCSSYSTILTFLAPAFVWVATDSALAEVEHNGNDIIVLPYLFLSGMFYVVCFIILNPRLLYLLYVL